MQRQRRRTVTTAALLSLLVLAPAASTQAATKATKTTLPAKSIRTILTKAYAGTYRPMPSSAPKPVTGKNIWVVTLTSVSPSVANIAKGVTEAGKLLGWNTTVFDGKGTPTGWNDGIRQAIAAKADAIVLDIVECQPVQEALKEARAAGIKIYGVSGSDCDVPEVGLAPLFDGQTWRPMPGGRAARLAETAKMKAAWIVAQAGTSAEIMEMTEPDYQGVVVSSKAFHDALASLCKRCKVDDVPFNLSDLGTQLRPKTEAGLLKFPKAKVAVFPYDSALLLGGAAAIAGSGRVGSLLVMGGECLAPNVELIRSGGGQSACVAVPYPRMGWAAVDALNRIFQGQPEADSGIGNQLVDKDHNLPAAGVTYDGIGDYQANYKKIWGVA